MRAPDAQFSPRKAMESGEGISYRQLSPRLIDVEMPEIGYFNKIIRFF